MSSLHTCLVYITFPGVAMSSTNKFRSRLACVISRPFFVSNMWVSLLWYIILLFRSCPSEMRFDSHSGTKTTLLSLMDVPSARAICTISTPSNQMISSLAVVKSYVLRCILPTKRLWSLVRWRNAHESRHQVDWICNIVGDSIVMKAFPG